MKIVDIKGYEILTTAGTSTVSVELFLEGDDSFYGYPGSAAQGTSKSMYEPSYDGSIEPSADVEDELVFTPNQGKINQALFEMKRALVGKEVTSNEVDKILCEVDGTENKQRLGSSIILATSIAACRAEATQKDTNLNNFLSDKITQKKFRIPDPLINIINGGAHVSLPTIALQEILLVPVFEEGTTFSSILFYAQEVFLTLQRLLKKRSIFYGFGLEGGIAAQWDSVDQPIELLLEAIHLSELSDSFAIGFDCAASTWFDKKRGMYRFGQTGKSYSSDQLLTWYNTLVSQYPIKYLEDPFAEHDHDAWKQLKHMSKDKYYIVGDDLCATQVKHIERPDIQEMINAVIIKPSQVGTVTETINAINAAKAKDLEIVFSRRSCETEDDFIVDLALTGSLFCKFGNITQGSTQKYNQLHQFFLKIANLALRSKGPQEVVAMNKG